MFHVSDTLYPAPDVARRSSLALLVEGQIPINSTDQLRMIILAATDDGAFDLGSLALGEVVRAQDDLRPFSTSVANFGRKALVRRRT
jgi:hypothetical protein